MVKNIGGLGKVGRIVGDFIGSEVAFHAESGNWLNCGAV